MRPELYEVGVNFYYYEIMFPWGLTVPFNNMQTLKFKIQLTIMLFTAINHCSGPFRKQYHCLGQKVMILFVCCDWQNLIHLMGICIFVISWLLPELWLTAVKHANHWLGLKFRVHKNICY